MEMEATTKGGGGGNTLSEIYQNAKKVQLRTRDALEYSIAGVGLDSPELLVSIKQIIVVINCLEIGLMFLQLLSNL